MHLTHYDYETVVTLNDGSVKKAKVDITATSAPSTFPTTGEGMTGKFPTSDPKDTGFLPGSTIFVPATGQAFMLDPAGIWNEI